MPSRIEPLKVPTDASTMRSAATLIDINGRLLKLCVANSRVKHMEFAMDQDCTPRGSARLTRHFAGSVFLLIAFAAASVLTPLHVAFAQDQSEKARNILKGMADYLESQKVISATFDADIEVVLTSLQKVQFTSSGELLMSRPNGLRARRSGGYSDVELFFDGKAAAIMGHHNNTFATIEAPGSVDQLVNRLRDEHSVMIPGADILLQGVYEELTKDATEISYIGHGVIDGKDTEHLAFRGTDVDWQIWVEIGPNPIPRKYVITSKTVTGAPQYTLRIKNWSTSAPVSSDAFAFKAPAGAKSVDVESLAGIDEVPEGHVAGGLK